MKFSLIIPCYNEAKTIPRLAARCDDVVAATGCTVILVNNGSTDDSAAVMTTHTADRPGLRVVTVAVNQGYGYGILAGLNAADTELLGWTHADMQTDPMDISKGLELFAAAADPETLFVKGQRHARPAKDVVFTLGMSVFESILMRRVLSDINAQPTMFHARFFAGWKEAPHDFSLDLFAYASAKRAGMRVMRIPVEFGVREHGQSSWNVDWSSKRKFIKRTVDYSLKLRRSFDRSRKQG